MNWEVIGIIIEGVSALAVIGTLFYVAAQIRQNTAQARRAEKDANLEHSSTFRLALAENQDLAEIWAQGLEDYDSLASSQRIRFESLMSQRFWIWNHMHDRITKGLSGENWAPGQHHISELMSLPGARLWWSRNRVHFPPEFADEVTRRLPAEPRPNNTMKDDT